MNTGEQNAGEESELADRSIRRGDEATVRALLAAAGLHPPEDEVAAMVKSYPGLRAAADALFTDEVDRFLPAWLPTDADHEAR